VKRDFLDPEFAAELRRRGGAPDVTAAVMFRLGLSPVTGDAARRRRLSRAAWRAGLACAVIAIVAFGVHAQLRSAATRRAAVPTLPSAIRHDLEAHSATISRAVGSIRGLEPTWTVVGAPGGTMGPEPPEPRPPARPTLGEPPL